MNCYLVAMQLGASRDYICTTNDIFKAIKLAEIINDAFGLDYCVYGAYGYTQQRHMSECALDVVRLSDDYYERLMASKPSVTLTTNDGLDGVRRITDAIRK